jgi:hypothetical protein
MRTTSDRLLLGAAAGVAATVVIDVITMAVMPLMGLPATSGFAVIGDTAAGFFALLGLEVPGGVWPGVILHYLIGCALGALFAAATGAVSAFRLTSIKRGIGLGVVYTEVISLPILVTPPLILDWSRADALQWFGFSFLMHAIWGTVLGAIVAYRVVSAQGPQPTPPQSSIGLG